MRGIKKNVIFIQINNYFILKTNNKQNKQNFKDKVIYYL